LSEERTLEFIVSLVTGFVTVATLLYIAAVVYQLQVGRVVTEAELAVKVKEGKAFSSSKRLTVPAGNSVSIVFINKSDRKVKVAATEIDTLENLDVDIYDNVQVNTEGNKWTIRNLDLKSDYVIDVTVADGGDYVGGEPVHQTVAHGGAKNFAIGSLSEVGEGVIVHPNQNIMITLTNSGNADVKCSVRFVFYEVE